MFRITLASTDILCKQNILEEEHFFFFCKCWQIGFNGSRSSIRNFWRKKWSFYFLFSFVEIIFLFPFPFPFPFLLQMTTDDIRLQFELQQLALRCLIWFKLRILWAEKQILFSLWDYMCILTDKMYVGWKTPWAYCKHESYHRQNTTEPK